MLIEPLNLIRLRQPAVVLGLLACSVTAVRGALWESPDWALTGTLDGAVGYDSNLTLSRNSPGDTYVQAKPQLTFGRRNSRSDFHVDAVVTGTEFINNRQPSQTDFGFSATYAYPFAENVIPLYKSRLSWERTSEPDQYIGHRVRHDRAAFNGEGFVSVSGKLGLRGELDAYDDKFDAQSLNHNSRALVYAGLAYEKRPGLQGSINVGAGQGRSKPNREDIFSSPVRSDELYVTAKAKGEITGKLTGSVYGGFGQVRYKGDYSRRNNLPVAGADLTWGIDPRRTLVIAAYSGAEYTPDGQAVNTSRAFISFTHVVIGRWQYIVKGGPTHTIFRREVRQSTDDAWEGGVEFAYKPSDRFRVGLGTGYGRHYSDIREREYDRYTVGLDSSYRF